MAKPPAVLALLILAVAAPIALAEKPAKQYPEEGKIVGTGLNEFTMSGSRKFTHTYTVVTATKVYLLDCDKKPVFASTGEECGGDKKLQIGDVIHFRIEKGKAYIPIAETISPVAPPKQGEQKLRILNEELKPEGDKPAQPQSGDAKPQ